MLDYEFLNWMADRLVYKYGESSNIDFVMRLRDIPDGIKRLEQEQAFHNKFAEGG